MTAEFFPKDCSIHGVDGGMLLWVKLPAGVSSRQLFRRALDLRIRVLPGAIFSNSPYGDGYIRLSCGWGVDDERRAAIRRLGQLCFTLMGERVARTGAPRSH